MEQITLKNVSFRYPSCEKYALKNINLSVNRGEFLLICGKSGSGKSTLLRLLNPCLSPCGDFHGEILFDGRDISSLSPREAAQSIGFTAQNPESGIVCDKVYRELAFGLESLGVENDELRARIAETASFFGIENHFFADTSRLSGGQKQLLCLAAATVMRPSVLILDEPTSQLDPVSASRFLQMLAHLNRDVGITVIMTDHSPDASAQYADRIVITDDGEIISDLPVLKSAQHLYSLNHPMLKAFPLQTRLYVRDTCGKENPPLTVNDGRKWLSRRLADVTALPVTAEEALPCGKPTVEIKNARFRYEKNGTDILHDFSFKAWSGEVCALFGGNAAGKTTAFSLISGVIKPYSGNVTVCGGRCAAISQNPQAMFSHKTLKLDINAALSQESLSAEEAKARFDETVALCELTHLLDRHPYDLSGGEQQRATMALALCRAPQILLLDEPTKGLDADFKEKLGHIIRQLAASGKTVIITSHDTDFCAEYADRCALMFGGKIASRGTVRHFFANKSFYTTSARRLADKILPDAVTAADIERALGLSPYNAKSQEKSHDNEPPRSPVPPSAAAKKKRTPSAWFLLLPLLISVTIFMGDKLSSPRKYYFTSMLIIAEALLPLISFFRTRVGAARELSVISVMCAAAVCSRAAFAPIGQFKPMAAVIMICALCFGAQVGFFTGAVSAFMSNFIFGQGPWTPWQMLAFGMLGLIFGLFAKPLNRTKKPTLCLCGFLSVIIVYGGIMNLATVILGGLKPSFAAFWLACVRGLSADAVHALSTAVFLWLGAKPLSEVLERIKLKHKLF